MTRVGLGIDAHRLEPGLPLMLGTIHIDHPSGLAGHSDGDVVAHALCDALLSAIGGDDIGVVFPGTPEWAGVTGERMLQVVAEPDCAVCLCVMRNTCDGQQFLCDFQQLPTCLFRFGVLAVHSINPSNPPKPVRRAPTLKLQRQRE